MKRLLMLLKEGRKDEKSAPIFYAKLKSALPTKYRPKITYIQNQERNHYKILRKIQEEITEEIKEKEKKGMKEKKEKREKRERKGKY